jgi:hypothetical protein
MKHLIKNFISLFLILSLTACSVGKYSSSPAVITSTPNGFVVREDIRKPMEFKDYSVATILNCGEELAVNNKSFSILGSDSNLKNKNLSNLNFSGWNHTTSGNATEWMNLKLGGNNYNFNDEAQVNSSCNDVYTLDIVLLKKIADWNHQHSNGFECNILTQGIKFGDIENLVFDLKINSAKTNIPSVESIKKTYANYVNEAIVNALEDGKVNIGITLGDNTNLNGTIIFQLDQNILSDKWVRVTIPMNKLSFSSEINYKKTHKTLADLSDVIINRMLIVGETKSGSVLRNSINNWDDNVPVTFKEMDISFKKIELQLK